jgi:chemotaxis protein MotB
MLRHLRIGVAVIAAGLITSGCVSSGKFKKMEAAKNSEITSLQQQKTALEGEKQSVEQQRTTLETDNNQLKEQVAALEQSEAAMDQQVGALRQQKTAVERQVGSLQQQKTAVEQQVGSLQQQNAALLAASQRQQQQYEALVQGLSGEVEKGQIQVKQYQNMLTVDVAEKLFFDSGRAKLKTSGKDVLKKVGEILKGYENKVIRVVGHTDNVPIAKSLQSIFPSNWELSVSRATNVVRYLQDVGVPPERMVASGRSEYEPVAPNDSPEGRQKNRRIEIMLIDKSLVDQLSTPAE